jgi:hypothetical protein
MLAHPSQFLPPPSLFLSLLTTIIKNSKPSVLTAESNCSIKKRMKANKGTTIF